MGSMLFHRGQSGVKALKIWYLNKSLNEEMEQYRHIIKENAAVLKMGVWLVGLKMNESHVAGARWEERWDRERGVRGHIVYYFTDYH